MEAIDKIEKVLYHIGNVQRNCYKLGITLIKQGDIELGRNLIANGQIHDNSKFKGIEFDELWNTSPILSDVVKHHNTTNQHHPDYWGSIHKMPEVYIAEMVCDCSARAMEFGTNVRTWFSDDATARYKFNMDDEVGKKITYFINLLLEAPFKKL